MSDTERGLAVNITTTASWTQMTEGPAGAVYAVPTGGRGVLASLVVFNLDADSVVVDVAISTNGTIADAERMLPPITLLQYESLIFGADGERELLGAGEALWIRGTGTTPNLTGRAVIMEVVP